MSVVWSCNEWDQLEEVIVGNPLRARFPTTDGSTQLAEFPDRSLEELPQGLDVIRLKLQHSKMLGGGYHCITLDIRRKGTLQRYFD